MSRASVAILHYTAPPVIGGVEAVMQAQARELLKAGYTPSIIAGRGSQDALPQGTRLITLEWMDTSHPQTLKAARELEAGVIPVNFDSLVASYEEKLSPLLREFDAVIMHNILFKHFNLPLTAALYHLIQQGAVAKPIAWGHDFTWSSPNSRGKVFPGYPWELLKTYQPAIQYVAVSQMRRQEFAQLMGVREDQIHLVYNGVDPQELLGLSDIILEMVQRLDLLSADLILLMPVRVTQAKNIAYAIAITAELAGAGNSVRLIITGPPDPHDSGNMALFEQLKAHARAYGVAEQVFFLYGLLPEAGSSWLDAGCVGELYRLADLVLMPSLREGFGMPVLEAGLAGVPVFASAIPAVQELAQEQVSIVDLASTPGETAQSILQMLQHNPQYQLRRKVRQELTWEKIFHRDIEPLLQGS